MPGFKTALSSEPLRPLAVAGRHVVTAHGAARAFLRELLAEVKRETGHRIRELVVTMPVDSYEGYRAQLEEILRSVGVRKLRFLDEPLAAALGYGLGLTSDNNVLVVDIGGGTMNVALVGLGTAGLEQGRAEVMAKQGLACGGDAVDSWVLDLVCRRMGYSLAELSDQEETRLWRRLMLAEACRVKEAVFVEPSAEFLLTPPGLSRRLRPAAPGARSSTLSRDDLVQVLREGGFYAALSASVDRVLAEVPAGPVPAEAVQHVLMVGGSTPWSRTAIGTCDDFSVRVELGRDPPTRLDMYRSRLCVTISGPRIAPGVAFARGAGRATTCSPATRSSTTRWRCGASPGSSSPC